MKSDSQTLHQPRNARAFGGSALRGHSPFSLAFSSGTPNLRKAEEELGQHPSWPYNHGPYSTVTALRQAACGLHSTRYPFKTSRCSFPLLGETVQFSDRTGEGGGGEGTPVVELERRLIYKCSGLGILVELMSGGEGHQNACL